jgi:hypothetical protein
MEVEATKPFNLQERGSLREAMVTGIEDFTLETSKTTIQADEPLQLKARFRITGALREGFTQRNWEAAYDNGERELRLKMLVEVVTGRLLGRSVITPDRFIRRGVFYWTRDPQNPHRIWSLIVLEGREPRLPGTEEEARQLLFDVERHYTILGTDLGVGEHRLKAKAQVQWGRHLFADPGTAQGESNTVTVRVE